MPPTGFPACLSTMREMQQEDLPGDASSSLSESVAVDKRCSAVHRGVSRDGRFVGGGTRNQEPDGDTRRRGSDLDRFRPSDRCNTLRPVSLVYYIEYEMYVDVCRCLGLGLGSV